MNPLLQIPARARAYVYSVYSAITVALGATQVGFLAAAAEQPTELTVALAVWSFIGVSIGITAATHVPAAPDAHNPADRVPGPDHLAP